MDHLQSFNQSPSTIQECIPDCPSVTNTRDDYRDNDDPFFVCEIQNQAAAALPKARLLAEVSVSTSAYS